MKSLAVSGLMTPCASACMAILIWALADGDAASAHMTSRVSRPSGDSPFMAAMIRAIRSKASLNCRCLFSALAISRSLATLNASADVGLLSAATPIIDGGIPVMAEICRA